MAQNTRISCPFDTWTQLTNADVTGDISIMLATDGTPVYLQATTDATAPTAGTQGPLELLQKGDGWSEATIAEKFPGVAAVRLWARSYVGGQTAIIGISHG